MKQTARELAEPHWKFLESWLHKIFVDAFIHGEKHGFERGREYEKQLHITKEKADEKNATK